MMVRWSGEVQVNIKSQSELDIGGRETCIVYACQVVLDVKWRKVTLKNVL